MGDFCLNYRRFHYNKDLLAKKNRVIGLHMTSDKTGKESELTIVVSLIVKIQTIAIQFRFWE
jgi:hypothetical protein